MNILDIFKVLANSYRLRVINLLMTRKFCVCQLEEILVISQPAVSRHLKKLTKESIINFDTDGKYYCYYFKKDTLPLEIEELLKSEFEKEIYKEDIEKSKHLRSCVL